VTAPGVNEIVEVPETVALETVVEIPVTRTSPAPPPAPNAPNPPPPPPPTTNTSADVTPLGTVQPPTELMYERGKLINLVEPFVASTLRSLHVGDPVRVKFDVLAAPVF
jgi:hypothetical protein